jgi:hypothetical protein
MHSPRTRLSIATAFGASAVAVLVVLLTIVGEEYAPVKNWLKATFSHHWLGKSYLAVLLFVATSVVIYPLSGSWSVQRALWGTFFINLVGASVICIYFLLHTLHLV